MVKKVGLLQTKHGHYLQTVTASFKRSLPVNMREIMSWSNEQVRFCEGFHGCGTFIWKEAGIIKFNLNAFFELTHIFITWSGFLNFYAS